MAKAVTAGRQVRQEQEEESTDVALYGSQEMLPAGLESELEGLTNLGYSEKAEDSLIPIMVILHDNSAEVKPRHERYIDGAMAGHLIIRALNMVIDPEKSPVIVQPAAFQHMWVQWQGEPGEGVVTGQYPYDDRPEDAVEKEDDTGERTRTYWQMPNGDRLVDTRYHYAFLLVRNSWMPIVIAMGGTNHTPSRGWTNLMKTFKLPNGQQAPAWFRFYRFTTKFQSRGTQSWFIYEIKDQGWVADASLRAAGRRLMESVVSETISPDVKSEGETEVVDEGAKAGKGGKDKRTGKEIPI